MSSYRRAYLPGGIYFFTVVTFNRVPVFTDENRVEALKQAFCKVKATRPFEIDAMVTLPEHLSHDLLRYDWRAGEWRVLCIFLSHLWERGRGEGL